MQNERWSEWRDHDGHGFPVPTGTVVQRLFDQEIDLIGGERVDLTSTVTGPLEANELDCWLWVMPRYRKIGMIPRVIRYRVKVSEATQAESAMAEA